MPLPCGDLVGLAGFAGQARVNLVEREARHRCMIGDRTVLPLGSFRSEPMGRPQRCCHESGRALGNQIVNQLLHAVPL